MDKKIFLMAIFFISSEIIKTNPPSEGFPVPLNFSTNRSWVLAVHNRCVLEATAINKLMKQYGIQKESVVKIGGALVLCCIAGKIGIKVYKLYEKQQESKSLLKREENIANEIIQVLNQGYDIKIVQDSVLHQVRLQKILENLSKKGYFCKKENDILFVGAQENYSKYLVFINSLTNLLEYREIKLT